MARPSFVFCDADAIIQFLLAQEVRPFRLLRSKYSIQPLVVPEVEIELLRPIRRFGNRVAPEFKKVVANGLLRVVDKNALAAHYGGAGGPMAAAAAMANIAKLGHEYQAHVDYGEAYTHAAALTLGVPALSHDRSALEVLIHAGLSVPTTVLRAFDLIALCYQVGEMTEKDCDAFRAALLLEHEYLPKCFAHKSFGDGLKDFCPRICDIHVAPVGSTGDPTLPYSAIVDL